MVRITILGTGNVARHLAFAFSSVQGVEIVQIVGRDTTALKSLVKRLPKAWDRSPKTTDFSHVADADVYLIAVSDDAIAEVSGLLEDKKGLVVHTSGSVSMNVLSRHPRRGVFYPLQTFSRDRKVPMKSVPFCLEGHQDSDRNVLKYLAGQLSERVYDVDSRQRKALHLSAIFVNNFTNHLVYIGQDICQQKEMPFDILHPLIRETVDKMEELSPLEAQTGPARRGDAKTIENHLEQLKSSDHKEVYSILSESILNLYRGRNA